LNSAEYFCPVRRKGHLLQPMLALAVRAAARAIIASIASARDVHRPRDKYSAEFNWEVIHLHGIVNSRNGIAQHQRNLAVCRSLSTAVNLRILCRPVTLAITQFGRCVAAERNLDPPEAPVQSLVSRVIAEDVITPIDCSACTIPTDRSLLSSSAFPPVSAASAYSVSCDC